MAKLNNHLADGSSSGAVKNEKAIRKLESAQTVGELAEFKIKFVEPSQLTGKAVVMHPRESLAGTCRVYQTHLELSDYHQGWTKHVALFFGALLGWILKPLFGSLSTSVSIHNLRWENILWVRFICSKREISICGKKERDGRIWLYSFNCDEDNELLSRISAFVRVEASEDPEPSKG